MYSTGGGGTTGSTRSFPALGFDPAEGDKGAVQALLLRLATASETIVTTLPRLEEAAKITDDSEWGGSAAEEFSDHGDDLPMGLGKGAEAMTAVSTALSTWLEQLSANQARADVLEAKAKKLKAQLKDAEADLSEAAGAVPRDTTSPQYDSRHNAFLDAGAEAARLDRELQQVIDDATRLQARHLREANTTADAVRTGKDGDPFKPENDAWYVQGFDGLATVADGVSLVTATAAAGLAATGVGVLPAAALAAVSTGSGVVGSFAAVGQQLSGSRNAPGWGVVGLGLGTSVIPGGGTAAAAARSAGRVALKGGSKASLRAARKDIEAAARGGALPGLVDDVSKIRKHGLDGKVSRDLTEAGRDVAKRKGIYDDLPRDVAERKAALQRLGVEAKQNQGYADLVDKGQQIAERAGVELAPEQRAELRLLQQGINPTPQQLDKAVEDMAKRAAEGKAP